MEILPSFLVHSQNTFSLLGKLFDKNSDSPCLYRALFTISIKLLKHLVEKSLGFFTPLCQATLIHFILLLLFMRSIVVLMNIIAVFLVRMHLACSLFGFNIKVLMAESVSIKMLKVSFFKTVAASKKLTNNPIVRR